MFHAIGSCPDVGSAEPSAWTSRPQWKLRSRCEPPACSRWRQWLGHCQGFSRIPIIRTRRSPRLRPECQRTTHVHDGVNQPWTYPSRHSARNDKSTARQTDSCSTRTTQRLARPSSLDDAARHARAIRNAAVAPSPACTSQNVKSSMQWPSSQLQRL